MILIINICKEKLHYFEFVKPIEDILNSKNVGFFTKHYSQVSGKDLADAEKVIICGTSLKDNEFAKNIGKFSWVRNFDKPLLGICGGMQILGIIFSEKRGNYLSSAKNNLKRKTEIGFYRERFAPPASLRPDGRGNITDFLGLDRDQEVYHLHNYYSSSFGGEFDIYCKGNGVIQAAKHKTREIYGVLFHPEVRQKKMIVKFVLG